MQKPKPKQALDVSFKDGTPRFSVRGHFRRLIGITRNPFKG